MERHVRLFLNRLSFGSIAIATFTLIILFLQTPETCVPPNSPSKPHLKFPKSSCDSTPRELVSLDKKNKRLWSTKDWQKKLSSFVEFFRAIRDLGLLHNHTKVLCVSAGPGHEVMALSRIGVLDVTGVELIDSPPLVSRADPHNLPFFDHVFDLAFTAHLAEALFPSRFVSEMERAVRPFGSCVIVVDECGDHEVREIVGLFTKSRFQPFKLKLVAGDSAGTATAFYMSSDGPNHNEFDFEFLGNTSGDPYTVKMNIYVNGVGNREQRLKLWYDPMTDFHISYSIFWNRRQVM